SDFASLGSFTTGAYPDAIAFSPDDKLAYAGHTIYPSAIDVYSTSTFTMEAQFQIPDAPIAMCTDRTGRELVVAFEEVYSSSQRPIVYNASPSPIIVAQPPNQYACNGGAGVFSVNVSGGTPLSYQWYKGNSPLSDGGNISGANAVTLVISPAGPSDID